MDVQCEPTGREVDETLESIKALVVSGACDGLADDIRNKYISPVSILRVVAIEALCLLVLSFLDPAQLIGGDQKGGSNAEMVLDDEYHQVSDAIAVSSTWAAGCKAAAAAAPMLRFLLMPREERSNFVIFFLQVSRIPQLETKAAAAI